MKPLDRLILDLQRALGEDRVRTDEEHRLTYARDESGIPELYLPDAVVHPQSTHEVSVVAARAYDLGIPLVPRGAGTGVTGGALAVHGGVLVVFDRMNRIKEVQVGDLTLITEPGAITLEVHEAAEAEGLFYPPDPASLDSCSIGGNVAENAGGPRALKYGVTKHYVLELEVVLPDGSVHRFGRPTKKWVTGYDLVSLITGSEGTLGFITEITLRLVPKPPHLETLLVPFPDVRSASVAVTEILRAGILPRTLELMDHRAIEVVREKAPPNLPPETGALLIFEQDGKEQEVWADVERAAEIFEKHGALDLLAAQTEAERDRLWRARRSVLTDLQESYPIVRSEDLVFPRTRIPEAVEMAYRVEQETGIPLCTFGHIGDGNLHVNLLYSPEQQEQVNRALQLLYQGTVALGGTISGEHGIGLLKRPFLAVEQSAELIGLQRQIKALFDPKGLMNPGKIF